VKFASLGSGSSGNATLISDGDSLVLLDCGFGIKETEKRMLRLGCAPDALTGILVTHEHSDHIKGVAPLARKYNTPVYMTEGTLASRDYGRIPELRLIRDYAQFTVGCLTVTPVVVPHDAREPAQFILTNPAGLRLGVLTDLGSITSHIEDAYRGCDGLLLEANHDLDMLARGPYPPSLKSRVSSPWGHLNNGQTAQFLRSLELQGIQEIVVGHISRKNNSIERVQLALQEIINEARSVHFACQDDGFGWLELEKHSETEGLVNIS